VREERESEGAAAAKKANAAEQVKRIAECGGSGISPATIKQMLRLENELRLAASTQALYAKVNTIELPFLWCLVSMFSQLMCAPICVACTFLAPSSSSFTPAGIPLDGTASVRTTAPCKLNTAIRHVAGGTRRTTPQLKLHHPRHAMLWHPIIPHPHSRPHHTTHSQSKSALIVKGSQH
jgi:hypothetical protein